MLFGLTSVLRDSLGCGGAQARESLISLRRNHVENDYDDDEVVIKMTQTHFWNQLWCSTAHNKS